MKLHYKKMFVLGICFLALGFTWTLYNSYVPILLKRYFQNNSVIGFVMSLNNYANLFVLPIFGVFSDKISTRIGRRMPFIVFGMTASAVILCTIPIYWNLVSLIVSIAALNIITASFRAPLISLMPDLTPNQRRSSANGIINLMGGAGVILAYSIGSYLFNINKAYPFYTASVLIIMSLIVLYIFIRENEDSLDCCEIHDKLLNRNVVQTENDEYEENDKTKNVFLLLMGIFFMFCTFNTLEIFLGTYGRHYFAMGESASSGILTIFSLFSVIFSLPAGIIGDKIGRKKSMIIGLSAMILIYIALFITSSKNIMEVLFGGSGICWALIYINAYPLLVSMKDNNNTGRLTGYYYIFISLSTIITPILMDFLINIFGYNIFFIYIVLSLIISLILIIPVNLESDYDTCHNTIQSDCSLT